jgi:hypothetical protein
VELDKNNRKRHEIYEKYKEIITYLQPTVEKYVKLV